MPRVLGCIAYRHDLGLVALSALVCILGCFTTTTLLARACTARSSSGRWLTLAAIVFGCSIWSLHFIAMLAFVPARHMVYDLAFTAWSLVFASSGTLAGFMVWRAPLGHRTRLCLASILLGLGVAGMHYLGVAAISTSSIVSLDPVYVTGSVLLGIGLFTVALWRASSLTQLSRRVEVAGWLALAVWGLHFTGMAAITMVPTAVGDTTFGVLGTTKLAIAVAAVSLCILIASLAAAVVEEYIYQRALQELTRMRLMSNLAREVLFIHHNRLVIEVNNAGERLLKATASEIIGRPVLSLFTEESRQAFRRREACTPADRQVEEMEVHAVDGTRIAVELSCQPIDYLGKAATVVALRDLTDRRRNEAHIHHLARHDALTGLPNRHTLLERLGNGLDVAAQQRSALAVVYIDLDRFKPVNDLHGHAVGDALLVQVAERMAAEIQSGDTLARIGGDEFVLILATELQSDRASVIAARTIDALHRPFQVEGHRIEISASAGIALYPDDGATADTLMRAADAALYRVKEDGRGAVRFYEASMNAQLQARLQLKEELAGAVERGELTLHYQPIVNGASGELEAFEALIRWNNPRRGPVPPMEFIPLAEETGLINQIGCWVIDTACRDAKGWNRPWRVAVNVSPRQFHQSTICQVIDKALRTHVLEPQRLVVEVTEGVLIKDADKAVGMLNELRELGVRISLDDFGTGYSSLSYLQLFKFDKFKIDKSFVKKLGESEDALTLTRTIINLGHNLGLHVTAEGVETPAQLAILRNLRCDQIQGYLVGRPAPLTEFTERDRQRISALFAKDHPRLSVVIDQ